MKWHKGKPPSIGWWPASMCADHEAIRWWDGKEWSVAAYPYQTPKEAAQKANFKSVSPKKIMWTDRWWEKKNG